MKKEIFAGNFTALFYFKKCTAEDRILVEICHTEMTMLCQKQYWFRCSKNNDFYVKDKERSSAPKKFEDKELEALLREDSC